MWTKRWHIGHGDNHLLFDWIWGLLHSKEFRPDTCKPGPKPVAQETLKKGRTGEGSLWVPEGKHCTHRAQAKVLKGESMLAGRRKRSQTIQDLASHQKQCSSYTEWKLAPGSRQIRDPVLLGSYRDYFVCCVGKRCEAVTAEAGN